MELEEAATHLHRLTSFYHALGVLEEIIATARSVDNIKNLAAERMEAAEVARVKMADAQAALATFELLAAKKTKEIEDLAAMAEREFKRRLTEQEGEFESRRIAQEGELKKMQAAFANSSAALVKETDALVAKRDEMAAAVEKTEKALADLRKKVSAVMG